MTGLLPSYGRTAWSRDARGARRSRKANSSAGEQLVCGLPARAASRTPRSVQGHAAHQRWQRGVIASGILCRDAMHQKRFSLSRSRREDMWRRFKQTDDRRLVERLHAILLLDSGQNAEAVSAILHSHPRTLKRWIKHLRVAVKTRSPLNTHALREVSGCYLTARVLPALTCALSCHCSPPVAWSQPEPVY